VLKLEISYRGLVVIGLALLTLWAAREVWPVILLFLVASSSWRRSSRM
jgi:hypothetical protein